MSTFAPVRVTAMYRAHVALGARFTTHGDWKVPDVYRSADEEATRANAGAGIADVSACGKLGLRGADVDAVLTKLTGQAAPGIGRALRARLDGTGALVARVALDEALVLWSARRHASAEARPEARDAVSPSAIFDLLSRGAAGIGCAHVTDLTSAFAIVDLVGPTVATLLERVCPVELSAVAGLSLTMTEVARVRATIVRLDSARPVFRVLVPREYGEFVWHALCDAGQDLGLVPVGAAAHAHLVPEPA